MQSNEHYMHQQALFKNMTHNMQAQGINQLRLALPGNEGIQFLMPQEVIRCEASGNYTVFHIKGGKQQIISKTLGEYEELLNPYHFIRTHKSHLVNLDFISYVDHNGFVILHDSTKVEISRRRKGEVMAALRQQSINVVPK